MKRAFYITAASVVAFGSLLLLQPRLGAGVRTRAEAPPSVQNVLNRVTVPGEPVEVSGLQVGGNDITAGTPFAGGEDWVSGLSGVVTNTSGKVMTELRMSVSFDAGGADPHKVAIPLAYAGPVSPGQAVRVLAPAAGVASLRGLLAKQGLTPDFRRAELRTQYVKFQDGSLWVKGVTLGPRDPNTGRRKHS